MQGDVGVVALVAVQQCTEIGARQYVAVEHQSRVVPQLRRDIGDTAASAQWFGLDDVFDPQPQLGPVTELRLEHPGLVRRAQHHVLDTGIGDPR